MTPNHFLMGSSNDRVFTHRLQDVPKCHRKQWNIAQSLADHFWNRWLREYLPTLIKRPRWTTDSTEPKKGQLVNIADDQAPRNTWRKGITEEILVGKDGRTCTRKIRTDHELRTRPMTKIILIGEDPVGTVGTNKRTEGEEF